MENPISFPPTQFESLVGEDVPPRFHRDPTDAVPRMTLINFNWPTPAMLFFRSPPSPSHLRGTHILSILILFAQKVLLSIVDPWDVSVASVDPVGLAERRGVSLSILVPQEEGNTGQEPSTPGRTVKIPSPWYKPAYNNAADRFPTTSGQIFETGPSSSTWVDPWHSSNR